MKKVISVFLLLIIVIFVFVVFNNDSVNNTDITGESKNSEITTIAQGEIEREISIGYFEGKSLNPYKTQSDVNRNLLSLVYDSLFLIDDDFTALPLIADTFTNERKKLTVTIRSDIVFSDGSAITADDIVYSFKIAKNNNFYSKRLSNVVSAAKGAQSVIFTLKRNDIYAENVLTFPIVKKGTGGKSYPIGSGRYTVTKIGGKLSLKANSRTTRNEEMTTEIIRLVPISAEKKELYLLQTGDLTYLFDNLSGGDFIKINANMVRVPLNNLVYLGLNTKSGALKDRAVRQAVEYCIDKQTLTASVYDNYCRITNGIFNPDWALNPKTGESESIYSPSSAEETLQKANYIYAYSYNRYRSKDFVFLRIKFLVNSENSARVTAAKMIVKELQKVGIEATLSVLPYDEYKSAIEREEFDIYLGEVCLSPNMDLSVFFAADGELSKGIDTNGAAAEGYFDFAAGLIDFSTFNQVMNYEKPIIPLCYRDGIACFSRELSYEGTINQYDLFKNAYSWEIN